MSETGKAVFLSYASQDGAAAQRVADALRAAGVQVWFDQDELRGGDAWDRKIKNQIRECALFVPIISANTQARLEGYFRLEWKLAEDRSHLMARGKPFLVPVAIDDTSERDAHVPEAFLAVQWTRLRPEGLPAVGGAEGDQGLGGQARAAGDVGQAPHEPTLAAFCARVKALLSRSGVAPASSRPSGSAGKMPAALAIPDYELIRKIGEGGYGEVWLARGLTGAYRAVKVVWRNRFADAEPFEREFRGLKESMSGAVGASGALALLHVGRDETAGFFYYVMELADDAERGRTIDPASYVPLTLKELRARRGRLPVAECREIGLVLGRELAALHARGLVHRDIKPSNVIVVNGTAKLADIGLVASVGDARTFVGTEGFVPPEGPGTPAADVFALGKVLYELVTGSDRQAFPQLPETFTDAKEREAYFKFNDVLLRACDPRVERRYASATALVADLEALQAGRRVAGKRTKRTGIIVVIAATALVAAWLSRQRPQEKSSPPPKMAVAVSDKPAPAEKSLVVLPLENLSTDPENAFFTEGMHEEIIATLSRLGELRVLSRPTALTLKGTKDSLASTGQKLGVAYALSGSVQRRGKHVRIALELRRTADESVVWQNRFEQEFVDGFALQDEIAAEVAKVFQVHTSTGAVAGAKFMTKNAAAYELFLKARELHATLGPGAETFAEQVKLCERAVALDPEFMAAASMLSQAYSYLFTSSRNTRGAAERAEIAAKAKRWAERASALMPGGAGDGALSVYYSRVEVDEERSHLYAQNEVRALPNDPNGHNRVAIGLTRYGRHREALAAYNRALALDPFHSRTLYNRVRCAAWLRDLPAFEEAAAKSLEFGGQNINRVEMHEFRFYLTGRLPESVPRLPDSVTGYAMLQWYARRFDEVLTEANRALAEAPAPGLRFRFLNYQARAAHLLSRPDVVAAAARAMMSIAESEAAGAGIDERQQEWMKMWALVYSDRKTEAVAIGRRLVERLSAPAQTSLRWSREHDLALVHAWFGDKKDCVEILTRLLKVPSGVMVPYLRLAPDWDNVRADPAFQALLADPKNSAPL